MPSIEPAGEVPPHLYLNPEYWEGHSIGVGATEPQPSVPLIGETAVRTRLQKTIPRSDEPLPIEAFEENSIFDPRTHPEGTVVVIREEVLSGKPGATPVQPERFEGALIPDRPTATYPYFGGDTRQIHFGYGDISYSSIARWGIVSPSGRKGHTLHTVPVLVVKKEGEKVIVSGIPIPRKGPIDIGRTKHYRDTSGAERLVRVNALEIMAFLNPDRILAKQS